MSNSIQFIIGCLLMSSAISYAWWVRIRLTAFREDLFCIRDTLFDAATAANRLDDNAYVEMRRRINASIRFAHMWSLPVFATVVVSRGEPSPPPVSDDPEFQSKIDAAIKAAGVRHMEYLVYDTITGRAAIFIASLVSGNRQVLRWFSRRVEKLLDTTTNIDDSNFVMR